ncbi:alpha/beta hydrolase domain-containing protein [Nocardioides sp.]|uniref:alpha/beta hydrolase domain-containing protein n=1 Tax=Nocardioides sp. TaxID=35761 RepID=UPI00321B7EE6
MTPRPRAALRALPPGSSGLLSARPEPDLAAHGYTEVEHVVSGRAVSYGAGERGLPGDGRFDLHEGEQADYATRVVVRRPEGETRASGTLVAEWLNVSSGADTAPDWTFTCEEILRAGHTWVGVSAQHVGVEGGGGSVSVGDLPPPPGLRGTDAQRYGDLHHPGDAFALDIFTQAVAAVRDLVAADVVLLVGASPASMPSTTCVCPSTTCWLLRIRPASSVSDRCRRRRRSRWPAWLRKIRWVCTWRAATNSVWWNASSSS